MNHARLYDIMSGRAKDPAAAATRLGLAILTPGYHLVTTARNKLYDLGIKKTIKLDRPVISVGNITTGGTGKTPMVIELARRLLALNHKPAVLMRGYMAGEKGATSDEAREIQNALGSIVPVMPNPDRVEGARRVLADHPETTIFLLDDGFQHRRVHRDLNLVLIDATRPFGFNHLLPRGLLRESKQNLKRADAIIITRSDQIPPEALALLNQIIQRCAGHPSRASAISHWNGYLSNTVSKNKVSDTINFETHPQTRPETGSDPVSPPVFPPDHLQSKQVTAACAIGNPEAFQRMLESAAGKLLHIDTYDDHHTYTIEDIQRILKNAKQLNADAVVTTEKDWVKWAELLQHEDPDPPILRPILGLSFQESADVIDDLLKAVSATDEHG